MQAPSKFHNYTGKSASLTAAHLKLFHQNGIDVEKFTGKRLPMAQIKEYCEKYDGVQIDVEPVKSGDASFLQYLSDVRENCPKPKHISVAASVFSADSSLTAQLTNPEKVYVWDKDYFDKIAPLVDTIMAMNYDIGAKNEKSYKEWCVYQAAAVKDFAARHPYGPLIQMGTPSYKEGRDGLHDVKIENYNNASSAYKQIFTEGCPENVGITVYSESEAEMSEATWKDWESSWGIGFIRSPKASSPHPAPAKIKGHALPKQKDEN